MKNMRRSLALSMLLHILPLVLMLILGGGNGFGDGSGNSDKEEKEGGGKLKGVDAEIQPKPEKDEPVEVELVDMEAIALKKKKKRTPHIDDKCENFFGGIGVQMAWGMRSRTDHTLVVSFGTVHKGYPADIAGIKEGDILLNHEIEIRGTIGTELTLRLLSDGQEKTVTLVRDKICIDRPLTPEEQQVGP